MGAISLHRDGKMLLDLVTTHDCWYLVMRIKMPNTNGFITKSGPRHYDDITFWKVVRDMGKLYRAIHAQK